MRLSDIADKIAKTTKPGTEARHAALREHGDSLDLRLAVNERDSQYWDNLQSLRLLGIRLIGL